MQNTRFKYLDVAKAGLIFLVIVGHFSKLYMNSSVMAAITTFVYFFHMPTFCFISGLLSKKTESLQNNGALKLLRLYVIFHLLYCLFEYVALGNVNQLNPLYPTGITWYLFSLFFVEDICTIFITNKKAMVPCIHECFASAYHGVL